MEYLSHKFVRNSRPENTPPHSRTTHPAERLNSALFHRFGGCKGRDSERIALIRVHIWGCRRERARSLPTACPLSPRRDNCVAWIVRLSAIAADQRRSACHARMIPSLFWWHVWQREPKRLKNRVAQDSKNVRKNRLHKRRFSGWQGGGEPLQKPVVLGITLPFQNHRSLFR